MPGKAETPKPPRRVQAPKQRADARTSDERRVWRTMLVIGALGFIGLAVALGFVLFGRGGDDALADAGCTVQTFPAQGQDHVEELPKGFKYNSNPPTTGPHNGVPAPFDFYDEPVDPLRLVHDQEHGGVVVHYGEIGDAQLEALRAWWRDDPNGIVVSPLPSLGKGVAYAAWTADFSGSDQEATNQRGVLAKCPRFDEGAADAFVDDYGFRGPERFPRDQLTPGS